MEEWYFGGPKRGYEAEDNPQKDLKLEIDRLRRRNDQLEFMLSETRRQLSVMRQREVSTLIYVPYIMHRWLFDHVQVEQRVSINEVPRLLKRYQEYAWGNQPMGSMWIHVSLDENGVIMTRSKHVKEAVQGDFVSHVDTDAIEEDPEKDTEVVTCSITELRQRIQRATERGIADISSVWTELAAERIITDISNVWTELEKAEEHIRTLLNTESNNVSRLLQGLTL